MRALIGAVLVTLCVACGPSYTGGNNNNGGSGGGDASLYRDAWQPMHDAFVWPDVPDAKVVCDEQDFTIEISPVRLMILQDLSGSMIGQRWTDAKAALNNLLTTWTGNEIEFGYDIFPDGTQENSNGWWCGTTAPVQIDCGQGNQSAITTHQNTVDPDLGYGLTPLHCAMANFTGQTYAPSFTDPTVPSYLLLVSDGADTCGASCPQSGGSVTEQELRQVTQALLANGVNTVVIGFGGGVDVAELNAIAEEGGTQFTTYIEATDQVSLTNAFNQIAESVVSCTYDLDEPDATADPDQVNFYFDGVVVEYDEDCAQSSGWTWTDATHTQVEFCEASCTDLKSGNVSEISAKFGCPTIVVD